MKARHVVLVALIAAVTLTSVAAAHPAAQKQRVAFTTQAMKPTLVSPFVLTPLQAGGIKRDSGKLVTSSLATDRNVVREGLSVTIVDSPVTLKGKLGALVVRYRSNWIDAGNGYSTSFDTWKVVRGTGQYAGATGGGRGASVSLESGRWSSHAEGYLTLP